MSSLRINISALEASRIPLPPSPVAERPHYNFRKSIKLSVKGAEAVKSNAPFVKGTYRIKKATEHHQKVSTLLYCFQTPRYNSLRRTPLPPLPPSPEPVVSSEYPYATEGLMAVRAKGHPYWARRLGNGLWEMYFRDEANPQTHVTADDFLSHWNGLRQNWDDPSEVSVELGGTA